MTTKPQTCRTHNGTFRIEVRRGRPPVNCSEDNPCDQAKPKRNRVVTKENTATSAQKLASRTGLRESQIVIKEPTRVERAASAIKNRRTAVVEKVPADELIPDFRMMDLPALKAYARKHFSSISKLTRRGDLIRAMEAQLAKTQAAATEEVAKEAVRVTRARAKAPETNSEPRSQGNRSVLVAQAARSELEALGWTAKGRGWTDGEDACAELTATRGSETLVLTWRNGNVTSQDYSLWHTKPSRNAMPKRRLKFNPDEMTDGELIRAISGMKVTWWNSLAQSEESYTIGTKTLSIEHSFTANGDEDSARRIVKFVDMNGGGFRHFHVDALLKVG